MSKNPEADFFFDEDSRWKEEYGQLRRILLGCGLTEEVKWGCPCYTHQDSNVVLIHGFKKYCALLFHKGALLEDPDEILVQQTKNVQAARQLRFTSLREIEEMEAVLKTYIREAIEVEEAGLEVKLKDTSEFEVPKELQKALEDDPDLEAAFEALTPGRQRGYLLYFSQAKQSSTRDSRIQKHYERILAGKGLNDR